MNKNNKSFNSHNSNFYGAENKLYEQQQNYTNVTPEIITDQSYQSNANEIYNDNYSNNFSNENFSAFVNSNYDNPTNYGDNNMSQFATDSFNNQFNPQFEEFSGFGNNNYNNEYHINNNQSNDRLEFLLMQELLKTMSYEMAEQKLAMILNRWSMGEEMELAANSYELLPVKRIDEQNNISSVHVLSTNKEKLNYTTVGNTLHIKNDLNIFYSGDTDDNEIEGLEIREDIKPIRAPAVKSMLMSQNYVPPLTISADVDMTEILTQQKKLKSLINAAATKEKFSTISFVVKAISIALEHYPKLNSFYDPDTNELVIKKSHHIGIATETSDGLIIPVIKYVEQLSLKQLSENINDKNCKLREGTLSDYDILGSTITIVNYGAIGAVQAIPTIYYPNSSVIGVGRIVRKPVVMKGDKLVIRSIMNLTVTVDQRIIDSAEAGIFLSKLQEILEAPDLIVLS